MWGMPDELFDRNPTFRDLINFNRYNGVYDVPEEEFDEYVDSRVAAIRNGGSGPGEFRRKDGIVYQYQCVVLPDNGRMLTYFDITRHKNTEAELARALEKVSDLANRDALTGLPNLRFFQERLLSTLSMSKRKGWKAAVMFIDLDGFKNVNDSFGHEAGDKILKMVAQRLLKTVRKADTVARIGGDEFLIIQTEVNDKAAAAHVAGKIVQQLAAPFDLDGNEIHNRGQHRYRHVSRPRGQQQRFDQKGRQCDVPDKDPRQTRLYLCPGLRKNRVNQRPAVFSFPSSSQRVYRPSIVSCTCCNSCQHSWRRPGSAIVSGYSILCWSPASSVFRLKYPLLHPVILPLIDIGEPAAFLFCGLW